MKRWQKFWAIGLGVAVLWENPILTQSQKAIAQTEQNIKQQANRHYNQGVERFYVSDFQGALESWEKALKLYRQINDLQGEARSLSNLGNAYQSLGVYQLAITLHQQSLEISRKIPDRSGEATSLSSLGIVHQSLGEYQQAIIFLLQSLEITREIDDQRGEVVSLITLGNTYQSLGEYQSAITFHQQSLDIARKIGYVKAEGAALGNLGNVYQSFGNYQQAVIFHEQSLDIDRKIGNQLGEVASLSSLGSAYNNLGKYQQAITFHQQSLNLSIEIGDPLARMASLNGLGSAHNNLGKYQQAISYYEQSLNIAREVNHRHGEAVSLGNLGNTYDNLGEYRQAITFHQQFLDIAREIGDKRGEAIALSNLGNAYTALKEHQRAMTLHQQSLDIARDIGNRQGEASSFGNLGNAYSHLGEHQQAINFYEQSLSISQEIGDQSGLAITFANLGKLFKDKDQPAIAIIFLKESTNIRESIRDGISDLDSSLQQSYLSTIEADYRLLADLLLKENRPFEAFRVLDLLKVQELDDLFGNVQVRSSGSDDELSIYYRSPEADFKARYDARLREIVQLSQERYALSEKNKKYELTPAESQRFDALESLRRSESASFTAFINQETIQSLLATLQTDLGLANQTLDTKQLRQIQTLFRTLKKEDKNIALLYPLVLPDRLELILVTSTATAIQRSVPITEIELNTLIGDVRAVLNDQNNTDFTPLEELHEVVIAPMEAALDEANIDILAFAPDKALRYIPLAALRNKATQKWLIDDYQINNITSLSLTNFGEPFDQRLNVFAGAFANGKHNITLDISDGTTTKSRTFPFDGLSYADDEVQAIAAVTNAQPKIDKEFSRDILKNLNDYSVIHFATHAQFLPATPKDSFLVFGDGSHLTLREMETSEDPEDNWDLTEQQLVILSACETALGVDFADLGDQDGIEILGLGYQWQNRGARATIASLWQVQDQSTQLLMSELYKQLGNNQTSHVEALQQAQIAINQSENYSHPFHWASFILIGNGL